MMAGVDQERSIIMGDDIEVPRRGYDTKDVEAMSRALDAAHRGRSKRAPVVIVLVVVAVIVAVWLLVGR